MKKRASGVSKYRAIVFSIALFLVFDLGVLIVNFYISKQFAVDAQTIDLAGRQATLAQRMTKSLFEIKNKVNSGLPYQINLDELKQAIETFDETNDAFNNGGLITGTGGKQINIAPITDSVGQEILGRGGKIWDGFKRYINPLMQKDYYVSTTEVQDVANYATSYNIWLLRAMNELTVHVRKLAQQQAHKLRIIQITGISLAIINFFIILFHFIRQLRSKDNEVQSAKRETDKIMETVNEGLFLINNEGKIGAQHSSSLPDILKVNDINDYNFFDYLKKITTQKTFDTAKDYIDVLFKKRVKEKLVKGLNPLKKVEASIEDENGQFDTQYLSFSFNRVTSGANLNNLLVTAKDITKEVMLEKELEAMKENASKQMDLLTEILPLDPQSLKQFLAEATDSLGEINATLKAFNDDTGSSYETLLNTIYRKIHKLKGDAAVIDFRLMQEATHEFETKLEDLKRSSRKLTGNDFIPITICLEDIYQIIETVTELIGRLSHLNNNSAALKQELTTAAPVSKWEKLKDLSNNIAKNSDKQVELHLAGFKTSVPEQYEDSLYQIAVQLVRNAVAHGIETPQERRRKFKCEYGQITLSLKQVGNGGIDLIIHDDGKSLDIDKIKKTGIEKGLINKKQASLMSTEQILLLLFEPGFSTTVNADLDSGRGVGMDFIIDEVKKLNGRLKISYAMDKFTSFRISLPAIGSMKGV